MSFLDNFHHNSPHKTRQQQHESPTLVPDEIEDKAGLRARSELDEVAGAIERAGLGVPASIALEVGKPLSWLGGQVLWVFQPFAQAFGISARKGPLSIEGVARILEREGGTEALVERLEAGLQAGERGGRR
ncbi:MAG TPA: hypothetical protein VND68_01310 [Chloroflexia bacterium]|jgi:hypothetical protein|nr:hypothetical protein [Chloroflexia bacterium]